MKIFFTLILVISSYLAQAQDTLGYYNYARNYITINGMKVLGGLAIADIGVGAVGWANAKSDQNRSFYKMTTIYGAGDLLAAVLGTLNASGNTYKLSPAESIKAQRKIETTFIINASFDVVYLGAGFYVKHRGDVHNYAQLKGFGPAMIIQSAALLLFDGTMYGLQRSNGRGLRRFLEKNPITFTGKGIGMIYTM